MRQTRRDPYLDAGMHGFIINTAKKEYWRVANWIDLDDLVQDGYMCYCKCRQRYGVLSCLNHPSKDHRRWMMALVRTTFHNHISTLARRNIEAHEVTASTLGGVNSWKEGEDAFEALLPPEHGDAHLMTLLASAPVEIVQLMKILTTERSETLAFRRTRLMRRVLPSGNVRYQRIASRRRLRETTNEYYCRLLGLDAFRVDVSKMITEYFNTDYALGV